MSKVCFLDMDGVLVNFVGGACRMLGRENPYGLKQHMNNWDLPGILGVSLKEFYDPMGRDFWSQLEPMPDCFDILNVVESSFGRENVCLLTSPVHTPGCVEGKRDWLWKHLNHYARKGQVLFGSAKHFVAHGDAWLVDDRNENVDDFELAGGNAVLVPRFWNRNYDLVGCAKNYVDVHTPQARRLYVRPAATPARDALGA